MSKQENKLLAVLGIFNVTGQITWILTRQGFKISRKGNVGSIKRIQYIERRTVKKV